MPRCTEAQLRAQKKYHDRLKAEGKERDHGDPEKNRQRIYALRAYKLLRKMFKEPEGF